MTLLERNPIPKSILLSLLNCLRQIYIILRTISRRWIRGLATTHTIRQPSDSKPKKLHPFPRLAASCRTGFLGLG